MDKNCFDEYLLESRDNHVQNLEDSVSDSSGLLSSLFNLSNYNSQASLECVSSMDTLPRSSDEVMLFLNCLFDLLQVFVFNSLLSFTRRQSLWYLLEKSKRSIAEILPIKPYLCLVCKVM